MSQHIFTKVYSHLENKLSALENNIEIHFMTIIEFIKPLFDNITINLCPSDKSTAVFIEKLFHLFKGCDENRIKINLSGVMCKNGLCLRMLSKQTENQLEYNYTENMVNRIKPSKKFRYFCNAGKSYLVIAPDGFFYPCHLFAAARQNPLGKEIEEIYKSQNDYIDENVDKLLLCKDCWVKNICGGGCIYSRKLFDNSLTDYQTIYCDPFRLFIENTIANMFEVNSKQNKSSEQRPFITVPCDNF